MPERQTSIFLLLLALSSVLGNPPANDDDVEDEYESDFRGFNEYETWKPTAQSSTPEVILIKQKEPHHSDLYHSMSSISSAIKHHLPLLAVLAPFVAVSVLLPLKAYLGPSYIVYPPIGAHPPPDVPASFKKDRVGKVENEDFEQQSLAAQVMKMIEEIDEVYGEMTAKDGN